MPTLHDRPMSQVRVLPPLANRAGNHSSSLLTTGAGGAETNESDRGVSTSSFASTVSHYSNAFHLQSSPGDHLPHPNSSEQDRTRKNGRGSGRGSTRMAQMGKPLSPVQETPGTPTRQRSAQPYQENSPTKSFHYPTRPVRPAGESNAENPGMMQVKPLLLAPGLTNQASSAPVLPVPATVKELITARFNAALPYQRTAPIDLSTSAATAREMLGQRHPNGREAYGGLPPSTTNPNHRPLVLGSAVYPVAHDNVPLEQTRRMSHRAGNGSDVARYGLGSTDSGRGLLPAPGASDADLYHVGNSFGYGGGQQLEQNPSASTLSSLGNHSNRFTVEDYDHPSYNEKNEVQRSNGKDTPATVSGWENEDEYTLSYKKVGLWCTVLLLIIAGIAAGVSVGVTKHHKSEEARDQAASKSAASASSLSLARESASAAASSTATILYSSTLTVSPTSLTGGTSTALSLSTRPAATTTATPTITSSSSESQKTFSTTYGYQLSGSTTTVPLTYTLPPAESIETRENGQWQFTQPVTLPSLGPNANGASFVSQLRFRVKPVSTTVAARVVSNVVIAAQALSTPVPTAAPSGGSQGHGTKSSSSKNRIRRARFFHS